MAILIDEKKKVIVQGITGRTGEFATRYMLEYGTKVIGGVTPGRRGHYVWGVPVYNSVEELIQEQGVPDISLIIVLPQSVRDAALEALRCGVKHIHISTERVPIHDVLTILNYARKVNAIVTGCHPQKVILFGSRSKNMEHPDSDYDILIILKSH